jgi:hypothetical protein
MKKTSFHQPVLTEAQLSGRDSAIELSSFLIMLGTFALVAASIAAFVLL